MANPPDWMNVALFVGLAAGTVFLLILITRVGVKCAQARQAAVARLLAAPEQLERVWFVQREYNTHYEVSLRGRDKAGNVVTLASPSAAPTVWHQLQLAGIMVHPEP